MHTLYGCNTKENNLIEYSELMKPSDKDYVIKIANKILTEVMLLIMGLHLNYCKAMKMSVNLLL